MVKEIQGIRDKITAANDRKRVAQDVVAAADHLRDEIKKYIDKLQSELNDATRGLAEGTYEAAVKLAELEFQIQQRLVKESREVLLKAREVVADLERKLDEIAKFTRPVKEALDRYNPITLLIRNWLKDIDIASEEYIKASHRAGLLMLRSEGNPLAEYVEWHSCYGQVFMAVPKEVGQAGCLGKRYLEEISAVYDRFLEQLPELIQWIAAPTWKMRKIVEPAIKDALQEATIKVVGFLTDKSTAEFIDLLSNPKNADRGRLVEIYRRDASGKGLIVFNDVASIVDRDLAISDGVLDPEKFAPLKHSVTLAKLAILDVISLNQLVRDIIGDAPQPARDYFNGSGDNYSLLIGMVRSLDGNHQWQAYGLPYPRRLGVQHGDPIGSHYGYDGHSDPSKGLVIWTDEFLREKVFYTLFPTAVIGALQERPELKWRHYKFPTCAQNPFPSTQDSSGRIRSEGDQTCPAVSDATVPIPENSPDNPTEYQERYFRCSAADAGLQYTIAGPFRNKLTAQIVARKLTRKFPDMHLEVWKPIRQTTYWPVMLAACVPLKTAQQARDLGLRRRVDTQITVDRGRLPWAPQANSTKEHGLIGISTPLATTSTSRKINSYPLK